jgi:hypothetical protein
VGPLFGETVRVFHRLHGHFVVGTTATAVALGMARRARPGDAFAATYGAVLAVVPVFGTQYLCWIALPIALLGARPTLLFHVAASLWVAAIYLFPLDPRLSLPEATAELSLWPALAPYLILIAAVAGAVASSRAKAPAQA